MSGGSHVAHRYAPMKNLAKENGWRLKLIDRSGCRLEDPEISSYDHESCREWNRHATQKIIDQQPDYVFTIGTRTSPNDTDETIWESQPPVWEKLAAQGINILAIRDNPRFDEYAPECLQAGGDSVSCGRQREKIFLPISPIQTRNDLPENLFELDLTDSFCDDKLCPVIIGNIVAYRDHGHMTQIFANTMTAALREKIRLVAPDLIADYR